MAKSKLSYKRCIKDTLTVSGLLSEDGTKVTYFDEYDNEKEAKISELLTDFSNKEINFSISIKTDEELELPETDEE